MIMFFSMLMITTYPIATTCNDTVSFVQTTFIFIEILCFTLYLCVGFLT